MARYIVIYVFLFLLVNILMSLILGPLGFVAAMILPNVVVAWRYAENQKRTMVKSELFKYSLLSVIGSNFLMLFIWLLFLLGIYVFLDTNDQAMIHELVVGFWQELKTWQWREFLSTHRLQVFIVLGSFLVTWIVHFAAVYLSFNRLVAMFSQKTNIG